MSIQRSTRWGRLLLRLGGAGVAIGLLIAAGLGVWRWYMGGMVEHVRVTGASVVPVDTIRHRAGIPVGRSMDTLNTLAVADRVKAHPWIAHASVQRRPMADELVLAITEHTPVGLAVGGTNAPDVYVTDDGQVLPVPPDTAFDVPLVRGAPDLKLAAPVPGLLSNALTAVAQSSAARDVIAEVHMRPDSTIEAYTRPMGESHSIHVLLGRDRFPKKLRRLQAFLSRMRASPTIPPVRRVDVRFDGHIVVRHREKATNEL